MTDYVTAAKSMLNAFDLYALEREFGSCVIYHDEITDIIRSASDGSVIEIWNYPDVANSYRIENCGFIRRYYDTSTDSALYQLEMVEIIYSAIRSGQYVTIDDVDILRM